MGRGVQGDRDSLIAGAAVLVISALLLSQVLPGQFEGVALARNPMTFPRVLLALFALGGVALLLRGVGGAGSRGGPRPELAWRRVLAVLVLAGLYLAAFGPVGFLPSTLVALPAMMLLLGYGNLRVIALVTLIALPGLWYLFAEGFSIRPPGIGIDDLLRVFRGAP